MRIIKEAKVLRGGTLTFKSYCNDIIHQKLVKKQPELIGRCLHSYMTSCFTIDSEELNLTPYSVNLIKG